MDYTNYKAKYFTMQVKNKKIVFIWYKYTDYEKLKRLLSSMYKFIFKSKLAFIVAKHAWKIRGRLYLEDFNKVSTLRKCVYFYAEDSCYNDNNA